MYRKTKKIGNNSSLFGLKYHYYICNIRNRIADGQKHNVYYSFKKRVFDRIGGDMYD